MALTIEGTDPKWEQKCPGPGCVLVGEVTPLLSVTFAPRGAHREVIEGGDSLAARPGENVP